MSDLNSCYTCQNILSETSFKSKPHIYTCQNILSETSFKSKPHIWNKLINFCFDTERISSQHFSIFEEIFLNHFLISILFTLPSNIHVLNTFNLFTKYARRKMQQKRREIEKANRASSLTSFKLTEP